MRIFSLVILLLLSAVNAHAQLAVPNEAGLTSGHVHLNVTDMELHKSLWVKHFGGTVVQKGGQTACGWDANSSVRKASPTPMS